MPTVRLGAMELQFDSVAEVAELVRLIAKGQGLDLSAVTPSELMLAAQDVALALDPANPRPEPEIRLPPDAWDYESFWRFWANLGATAKAMLGRLATVQKETTSSEMADYLRTPASALGPAIRTIKSQANALGKRSPLIVDTGSGGRKVFAVTDDFCRAFVSRPKPPSTKGSQGPPG